MVITPGNGAAFQYRATADTSNLGNNQTAGSVTDWVKLTRSGQTITGYVSTNGVDWTQAGSYTFAAGALGSQVYIGLAVSAWNNNAISTATFGNVSISGEALPATPTNFTANSASNTSAALEWQDSDSSVFNYLVYRENPGDSSYTMIATLPGNVTNLTDTGLTSGATYAYQVVAVNAAGDSSPASASVTLPVAGGGDDAENDAQLGSGDSGTVDLAGSVSVLTSSTNITNNSTAADGILVSGTNQVVGDISGTGNLVIAAGADLTANSIVQNTLVIGAGATLTIAPSGGSTNASAAVSSAAAAFSTSDAATSSAIIATAAAPAVEPTATAQVIASSTDAVAVAPIVARLQPPFRPTLRQRRRL